MTAVNEPSDWRSRGACLTGDPDLFFPVSPAGAGGRQQEEAKTFCRRCEVRRPCLAFALRTSEAHGVWGGTTEDERRAWRLQARNAETDWPQAVGAAGAAPDSGA
jgi:WhiB family redox-sensing transcriptional regulator